MLPLACLVRGPPLIAHLHARVVAVRVLRLLLRVELRKMAGVAIVSRRVAVLLLLLGLVVLAGMGGVLGGTVLRTVAAACTVCMQR